MMEVSPSMSDIFYHQQQQQARMASAYLERMTFPFGYPQYPMYPSYREDDYGRRHAVVVPPPARFDPMSVDFPMEARPRSGSLGSTGSSLRDGHSPSFDSMTGGSGGSSVGDSVSSRDSPFSFTSSSPSPSPLSPPTPGPASDGGSKLRRVLMGTLSSPYSVLFRRVCPSPRDAVVDTNSVTPPQRKRKYDSMQTTPMDLSCKRPGTPAIPCSSHDVGPRNTSTPPSTEDAGHPSILKAILCGRHADADRRISSGAAAAIDATSTTTTATHSAMTPTGRPSPCPTAIANSCSTAASTALPVTLAKKNLLPVSARVLDWLLRTVRFARALPQFANLSHHDKVALLLNSWPRVLLLYMAETDFEFAVTTVPTGLTGGGDTRSPVQPTTVEGASGDSEVPTMNSVEGIQRFIRKCQALNLDSTEYEYMRMATLFHRGFLGVEDASYVDSVNTYVRRALREHIATRYPSEKLRYSSILLCLPGLFAINGRVVEALFCRQVVSDCDDTESLLKELLTRDSSAARAH